ncbi:hypothetical protein HNP37_001785 [Flavobacterium nitrogenifigens]|uniref:Uncharacterized protein n=2 Tax=Flavobacterium TaxID=237 RepID=A0A7W7N7Q6_9FLAO|nr:hypothetical protein [Flavobacterium nitrogenifigens]MBB6386682.1 hypothetical protein [Flavobacterium notoginsengisoli]
MAHFKFISSIKNKLARSMSWMICILAFSSQIFFFSAHYQLDHHNDVSECGMSQTMKDCSQEKNCDLDCCCKPHSHQGKSCPSTCDSNCCLSLCHRTHFFIFQSDAKNSSIIIDSNQILSKNIYPQFTSHVIPIWVPPKIDIL